MNKMLASYKPVQHNEEQVVKVQNISKNSSSQDSLLKSADNLLQHLKTFEYKTRKVYEPQFTQLLSAEENEVQNYVDKLSFTEGSWYRHYHNRIVPLSMLAIILNDKYQRDLMFAAQLHDIGYSAQHVEGTLKGAHWETCDMRKQHMLIGSEMARAEIKRLSLENKISIHSDRINKICDVINTHDMPYLGVNLSDPEELAHRDADRTFVMTGISFWKDFLAQLNDEKYLAKARNLGVSITPATLLLARLYSFSIKPDDTMPYLKNILKKSDSELVNLNENSQPEPQHTKTGRLIINMFFQLRSKELEILMQDGYSSEFFDLLEHSSKEEMNFLLNLSQR